jgi:cold shock CspA family protein
LDGSPGPVGPPHPRHLPNDEETTVDFATVTWFDPQRGIGMITVDGSGHQVPVRAAEIDGGGRQSLRVDDRVAFQLLVAPNGPRAVQVRVP